MICFLILRKNPLEFVDDQRFDERNEIVKKKNGKRIILRLICNCERKRMKISGNGNEKCRRKGEILLL